MHFQADVYSQAPPKLLPHVGATRQIGSFEMGPSKVGGIEVDRWVVHGVCIWPRENDVKCRLDVRLLAAQPMTRLFIQLRIPVVHRPAVGASANG